MLFRATIFTALMSGVLAILPGPKTTNVNTNFNNNYNSNLDLLFITLVNYLTEVLTVLQKSGHLPRGETDSLAEFSQLSELPTIPSLFFDPKFSHSIPEKDEQDTDLLEIAGLKDRLASVFPSAESVNINLNKNQNTNFNLLYDYLINYLVTYEQTKVSSFGEESEATDRIPREKDPKLLVV